MPQDGQFEMMQLGYAELEGVISRETLSFHHGKHLRTYVDNLNKALADSPLRGQSLQEVVRQAEGGMFNNAGQVLNHTMYFEQFCPGGKEMSEKLQHLVANQMGSMEALQAEMEQKGAGLFGSGWVWLSIDGDGSLVVTQHANADNPLRQGLCPLLTFDVWEHAYYLDYQNRRADYLKALWKVVDWSVVEERMA